MRTLGIEIAGDYNSTAIKEATAGVETFGRTVNATATKNIERLAAQRVKLQELAGEYRVIAASSTAGSSQQVAALDLVTRAEARLGLAVQKRAGETRIAEREIAKFTRGAASSSGSFGKMGLGLALGSGGFIAGAGAVGGIKVAIDAAKQLMTAQEQLSVAAHNVGVQLDAKQLDAYLAAETKVSLFTKAELTSSLIGLVRATKSVTQAQTDASLAANIARATGKDLADVTQGLINLEGGRTRSLVALGVKIPVIKTATDALTASGLKFTGQQRAEAAALDRAATAAEGKRILLERYHGSSERYAKSDAAAQDKLRVAENLLATSIGTVLLPVVKTIADPFAKWAQTEAESGDAAKKTKEIVGDLTTVLRDAKTVVQGVDDVTGGFKNTLELVIGLKMASVFAGWSREMRIFGVTSNMAWLKAAPLLIALGAIPHAGGSSDKNSMHNNPAGGFFEKLPVVGGLFSQANSLSDYINKALGITGGGKGGASAGGLVGAPGGSAVGALTTAGGGNSSSYFKAVLAQMGIKPTAANVGFLNQWAHREGVPQSVDPFNMLGTTLQVDGSHGTNGPGVQAYGSFADGVKATALMLSQGNFKTIRAALASGNPGSFSMNTDLQREFRLWSGGGYSWPSASGGPMSVGGSAGGGGNAAAIAALVKQGKVKPVTLHGSSLIPSGLLDKITSDANSATDSSGSVAAMWLHREKADLEKARTEVAAKLKGASTKQAAAINAELRTIDTKIASVNKSITTNLKEQANAIKANAKAAITTAKQNIAAAFGQIITDARSAFDKETQDYIDNVLSAKFLQGTDTHGNKLQTASEKKLADMQAADTAQQLQDQLAAAKQQLTDDTTGALLQHVVDITTGATKDIFGPAGTSQQRDLDQKAIDAAQRALDENTIAIDAAKERAQEDYDYAQAVKDYQQERSLAESAMVVSLNELEKNIETGKASFTDLQGVLAEFGVSISDIPTDQWSTDFADLGTAVQTLGKIMLDEAAALAAIGDGKSAAAVAAAAASITWGTPIAPGQSSVLSGLGGAGGMDLLNPYGKRTAGTKVVALDTGADILRDGYAYLHAGERVQSAEVARGGGGGGGAIYVTLNAPNYVGSHDDLVAAIKSPAVVEAVSTAVLVGNRRGHIRANQLT